MLSKQARALLNYVAANDPGFARDICIQYNYTVPPVKNAVELGGLLEQLVMYEGEPVFLKILDHHPDKDLILETFSVMEQKDNHLGADGSQSKQSGCGCSNCSQNRHVNYLNADAAGTVAAQINSANAAQQQSNQITSTQTGIIILAGSLIIALAIMSKK